MTNQMQRLMTRVDGALPSVTPASILNAPSPDGGRTRSNRRQQPASRPSRKHRAAPGGAGVLRGRVPRAIEALVVIEPGEMSSHLRAAGLL